MALLDRNDKVLVEAPVLATCGTGCWGRFDVTLSYKVSTAQWGTLRVSDISEYTAPVAVREYPVSLRPAYVRRGARLLGSTGMRRGAPGRTRTADAGLRTASLCPLSYGGAGPIVPRRRVGRLGNRAPSDVTRHGRRSSLRRPASLRPIGPSDDGPRVQSRRWHSLPSPTSPVRPPGLPPVRRDARGSLTALLDERAAAGSPTRPSSSATSRPIPAWQRAFFATIPVVELGDRRLELATSAGRLRRLLIDVLDA